MDLSRFACPSFTRIRRISLPLFLLLPQPAAAGENGKTAGKIIEAAEKAYAEMRDYTATFHRREKIGNKYHKPETLSFKFKKPFMVYMRWKTPRKGREVLFVRGRYEDKMIAHEGGLLSRLSVSLDPEGFVAMKGNRHPVTEAGIGHILEILGRDFRRGVSEGTLEVSYDGVSEIGGRPTHKIVMQATGDALPPYYCERAVIHFDEELKLPVSFEFYDPGDELIESYVYRDLRVNVGLTEKDFDRHNKEYRF